MPAFSQQHIQSYGRTPQLPVPEVTSDWAPDTTSFGGLPADRSARLAARRAFVTLKLSFLYVVEGLEGQDTLKLLVRRTETPQELWNLRAMVFAVLAGDEPAKRSRRQLLHRSLQSMFPDQDPSVN